VSQVLPLVEDCGPFDHCSPKSTRQCSKANRAGRQNIAAGNTIADVNHVVLCINTGLHWLKFNCRQMVSILCSESECQSVSTLLKQSAPCTSASSAYICTELMSKLPRQPRPELPVRAYVIRGCLKSRDVPLAGHSALSYDLQECKGTTGPRVRSITCGLMYCVSDRAVGGVGRQCLLAMRPLSCQLNYIQWFCIWSCLLLKTLQASSPAWATKYDRQTGTCSRETFVSGVLLWVIAHFSTAVTCSYHQYRLPSSDIDPTSQ
jgi:hypothetical protein